MESVECALCHRQFADHTLLSLHHEYETCFDVNSSVPLETNYICPICNKTFYDPLVLQIHVDEDHDHSTVSKKTATRLNTTVEDSLYAQDLDRREQMKRQYEQQKASEIFHDDPQEDDDARIARMLQEEEDAQSFEEFQVLK